MNVVTAAITHLSEGGFHVSCISLGGRSHLEVDLGADSTFFDLEVELMRELAWLGAKFLIPGLDGNFVALEKSNLLKEHAGEQIQATALTVKEAQEYGLELYNAIFEEKPMVDITALIDAKADVHWANEDGDTALYVAAQEGQDLLAQALITARADVNKTRMDGGTPLSTASEKGFKSIVETLLNARVNVKHVDRDGTGCLAAACVNAHQDVVLTLLAAKAATDDMVEHAILTAKYYGHADLLATLEGTDRVKDSDNGRELYSAMFEQRFEEVTALIAGHADVHWANTTGDTALYLAAQEGHDQIVEVLIAANGDVNKFREDGGTPLTIAAERGHHAIVRKLLEAKGDVNHEMRNGTASLAAAAIHDSRDVVQALLNAKAETFEHAILTAEYYNHTELVPILKAAKEEWSELQL